VGLALLAASGLGAPSQASAPTGVFRYSLDADIDYVDPALAYYAPSWEILYATCATLVSYPDGPAPRGTRLIPDGASAMPTVSRDGRTYTFHLRSKRFFSDGTRITAESYARALIRVLHPRAMSPGAAFFRDIVGAKEFADGTTRRQPAGIAALTRSKLRLRLVRRAPDLLARLAMPFSCPVKASQPLPVSDWQGREGPVFRGSGPYYVAEWERRRRIVLRPNRFYRGPRPQNVDRVLYDIGLPLATIKLKIDKGETDYGSIPTNAHAEVGRVHGVQKASPGRYFVNSAGGIRYLALNHERELFGKPGGGAGAGLGNVPLKRAINFAIDRKSLIEQRGAYAGVFNDQYLPPTIPGARNAAIYPSRPDVARARALAEGHMREGRAVLNACGTGDCIPSAQIIQANLREIGLDVRLLVGRPFTGLSRTRGMPIDMSLEGWHHDYFDPQDYLFLVDGSTIRATGNTNLSYFDSPEYNRRLAEAASLSGQARFRAFGALDVDLAQNVAPMATYTTDNVRRYFSSRVGGFFEHPVYGLDLAALKIAR
jgi:ABC-type oligopeptide transport system substrate-binding subunit